MRAWAEVAAGLDPAMVTGASIAAAAEEHGVRLTDGDRGRIEHEAAAYEAASGAVLLLGEGCAVEHGRDGRVVWHAGFAPRGADEGVATAACGAADYYNAVDYIRVREGDHTADLIQATAGRDGQDVMGGRLAAKAGLPAAAKFDPASFTVEADGRVVAGLDGVLIAAKDNVRISRLIEVGEYVDFHTGNIEVDGGVHVRKGVRDKFRIDATEDVCVEGLVESASIACGGRLVLRQGMASRDGGSLRVGGDAEVGFLNTVTVAVAGTLSVRRELMNCTTEVGGDLLAAAARVIGGTTVVSGAIHADHVGSGGQVRTVVVLGAVPKLESQRRALTERGDELGDAGRAEIDRLDGEIEAASRVDVTIKTMLHARTVLVVGGVEMVVSRDIKGPVRIERDRGGQLTYRIGSGPVESLAPYLTVGGHLRKAA